MKIKGGIRAFPRGGRYVRASPPGGSFLAALPALTRNIEEIFRGAGNSGEKGACAGLEGRAERVAE